MIKLDPIIAVHDIEKSSKWYQTVFNCASRHGGDEFNILVDENGAVLICLHQWGVHDHPSLKNPTETPGNGLMLYFRTNRMEEIRSNLKIINYEVAMEIQVNPNSHKKEFSVIDPNGYYLTISEYHNFEG